MRPRMGWWKGSTVLSIDASRITQMLIIEIGKDLRLFASCSIEPPLTQPWVTVNLLVAWEGNGSAQY